MKMPHIIAGCVVLSVSCAAPGAHAGTPHYFKCGEFTYYEQYFTYPKGVSYSIGWHSSAKKEPTAFRLTQKNNTLYVNGRRCVEVEIDEKGNPMWESEK